MSSTVEQENLFLIVVKEMRERERERNRCSVYEQVHVLLIWLLEIFI